MVLNNVILNIIPFQEPIPAFRRGIGRLKLFVNFFASNRISKILLINASKGAKGKLTEKNTTYAYKITKM